MSQVIDLFYDVVVQLQLLQSRQGVKVLDHADICISKQVLRNERDSTFTLLKFICGYLGMILF